MDGSALPQRLACHLPELNCDKGSSKLSRATKFIFMAPPFAARIDTYVVADLLTRHTAQRR
jgi:hypothetical protein